MNSLTERSHRLTHGTRWRRNLEAEADIIGGRPIHHVSGFNFGRGQTHFCLAAAIVDPQHRARSVLHGRSIAVPAKFQTTAALADAERKLALAVGRGDNGRLRGRMMPA